VTTFLEREESSMRRRMILEMPHPRLFTKAAIKTI
jgi:hypothetical protein